MDKREQCEFIDCILNGNKNVSVNINTKGKLLDGIELCKLIRSVTMNIDAYLRAENVLNRLYTAKMELI